MPNTFDFDIDLLKTNLFFNDLMDSLSDGILIADAKGYIRYVNAAYIRLTAVTATDVLDRPVQEVRKGSRLPEVLKTGQPLLGIRRTVNQIEYIADINPILFHHKLVGAISIVRDITQVEELSRKLKFVSHKVTELRNQVRESYRARYNFDDIIGQNRSFIKTKNAALRMSQGDAPVLILGESGTGKERFAHAIHQASPRCDNPFVPINCAAFPAHLLVSELFGYEEGAFTGASKGGKPGLFEIAHGGTLFLDEIGDMDFELQAKLLRVIETGEFLRVGGTKPIRVDVRIVSATHRDLDFLIHEKKFRDDLYYRLNVVSIQIPPLRERRDDLSLLLEHYLCRLNGKRQQQFFLSLAAMELLQRYEYPGNIRELINILEFAANTCEGTEIGTEDLPIATRSKKALTGHTLARSLRGSEKEVILQALSEFGRSVAGKKRAAQKLGISLATLYNRIKLYDLD